MPNRIEARSAKAALTNATGRLPLLRLFSTPLRITQWLWKRTAWSAGNLPSSARKILSYSRLRRQARKCGIHLGTLAQNSSYSGP
jgi:hypothetical protein